MRFSKRTTHAFSAPCGLVRSEVLKDFVMFPILRVCCISSLILSRNNGRSDAAYVNLDHESWPELALLPPPHLDYNKSAMSSRMFL